MSPLLGPNGLPASEYASKKSPKKVNPIVGEIPGGYSAGSDLSFINMPGGGTLQFDTSRLTLGDYRRMADHPQIISCLRVLTFMMHQLDWKLEGGTAASRKHCEDNMNFIWTPLVRAMASSFKFGYSANALQYENHAGSSKVYLHKIKDLVPEDCSVKWKYIQGAALPNDANTPGPGVRPKIAKYDGIRQNGKWTVPMQNSYWYPLLMENNDYLGTKILNGAFQSWYFSNLIKLFANQYYERFGSPLPVARAPYDEEINIGTRDNPKNIPGNQLMGNIISALRNRSAVVLPNQRTQDGLGGVRTFDYELEYIEGQMRGADFERYLGRLDEEMSLALFTPLLLMRTAQGGGYNQGVSHVQVFLWTLNAIAGDFKEYIDRYILAPMAYINKFSEAPTIRFRKMGVAQQETLRGIVTTLIQQGGLEVDAEELGQHIGLDMKAVKILEQPLPAPGETNPDGTPKTTPAKDKRVGRPDKLKNDSIRKDDTPRSVTKKVVSRVSDQATKAFNSDADEFTPSLGFRSQLSDALWDAGVNNSTTAAEHYETIVTAVTSEAYGVHDSSESFMRYFEAVSDAALDKIVAAA